MPGYNPSAQNSQSGAGDSAYRELPLSAADAQAQIEDLKTLLPQARPGDVQSRVERLCEWLSDMADAHYKLGTTFGKSDSTAGAADSEKQAARQFSQLKNQALLIKADLLIRQQRYPEALSPLVDIVIAEPRSATGQAAYKRLKEIGFSQEPEVKTETKKATTPAAGAPALNAAQPAAPADPPVATPAVKNPVAATPAARAPAKTPAVKAPVGKGPAAKAPAAPGSRVSVTRAPAPKQSSKIATRYQRKFGSPSQPSSPPQMWITGSPFGAGSAPAATSNAGGAAQ